jgi:hypothetical protein
MYLLIPPSTQTSRRGISALVIPFLMVATAMAAAPAAAAALSTGTGSAQVTIVAGTYDFYFVGTAAPVYGEVKAADPADGMPTGTIRVISNEPGNHTEVVPLLDGTFYSDAYPTDVGTRQFTVEYSGDENFAPATAAFEYFVPTGPDTETTLSADPSGPIMVGQSITFTAHVTDGQGRPLDGPTFGNEITFYDNGELLQGEQTWGEWESTLTTSSLSAGTHRMTAVSSAVFYETSTSNEIVVHVVAPERQRVKGTLSISPHGVIPNGTTVHAAAEFQPRSGDGVVTGWVLFYDFRTKLSTPVELTDGKAHFVYESLDGGPHLLVARYLGTDRYSPAVTFPRVVYVRR